MRRSCPAGVIHYHLALPCQYSLHSYLISDAPAVIRSPPRDQVIASCLKCSGCFVTFVSIAWLASPTAMGSYPIALLVLSSRLSLTVLDLSTHSLLHSCVSPANVILLFFITTTVMAFSSPFWSSKRCPLILHLPAPLYRCFRAVLCYS
jgi:hypothetical protein